MKDVQSIEFRKFKPYVWIKKIKENGEVVGWRIFPVIYVPEFKAAPIVVKSYGIKKELKSFTKSLCEQSCTVDGIKVTIFLSKTQLGAGFDRVEQTPDTPFVIYETIDILKSDYPHNDIKLTQVFVDGSTLPGGQGTTTVNYEDADD